MTMLMSMLEVMRITWIWTECKMKSKDFRMKLEVTKTNLILIALVIILTAWILIARNFSQSTVVDPTYVNKIDSLNNVIFDYKNKQLTLDKKILDFELSVKQLDYKIDSAENKIIEIRNYYDKKIKNAILTQSSFENFKFEPFRNFFSGITIILPWGNLLKYISECDKEFFSKLNSMLRESSECLIIFGYEEDLESSQTQRLQLPELNEEYIEKLKNLYENLPEFVLIKFNKISNTDINKIDSSWAKKLTFGKSRPYFEILLKKSLTKH